MKLVLEREVSNAQATIGVLFDPEHPWELVTLENPKRETSADDRIPAGKYICRRVDSPKFGDTFEVTNVPGRTHILFHAGNFESSTSGCILLGMRRASESSIADSRVAVVQFLNHCAGLDHFDLEILDAT